jgi:hypothetical protein
MVVGRQPLEVRASSIYHHAQPTQQTRRHIQQNQRPVHCKCSISICPGSYETVQYRTMKRHWSAQHVRKTKPGVHFVYASPSSPVPPSTAAAAGCGSPGNQAIPPPPSSAEPLTGENSSQPREDSAAVDRHRPHILKVVCRCTTCEAVADVGQTDIADRGTVNIRTCQRHLAQNGSSFQGADRYVILN